MSLEQLMVMMRDGQLVGIITETDIFKAFMEMLGARDQGVRLTVLCPDRRGELAEAQEQVERAFRGGPRWPPGRPRRQLQGC